MLKRILFLCALLLHVPLAFSAQLNIDSILSAASTDRATELKRLDELCTYYGGQYGPEALPIIEARAALIDADNNLEDGLDRISWTVDYYRNIGALDLVEREITYYQERLDETEDPFLKGRFWYTKSSFEELKENELEGLLDINRAIALFDVAEGELSFYPGEAYRAKGRLLHALNRFAESDAAYLDALAIFKAGGDSIGIVDTYSGLGLLYSQIGLYDKGEEYIAERLRYIKEPTLRIDLIDHINIGRNLLLQKRYVEAYDRYTEAVSLARQQTNERFKIYSYNGLIESGFHIGETDSSAIHLESMEQDFEQAGSPAGLSGILAQSRFFIQLDAGALEQAEQTARQLYDDAVTAHDASDLMMYAEFLQLAYRKMGRYDQALTYSDRYQEIKDSVFTANKTNALLLYRTRFETKEKELEITQLGAENSRQEARMKLYLIIAGLLGALVLIAGYLIIQLRSARGRLEVQNEQLLSLNATKDRFFSIIGHDLRSPMVVFRSIGTRIRRQLKNGEYTEIESTLEVLQERSMKLIGLLDNILEWALTQKGQMPYDPELIDIGRVLRANADIFGEVAKEKGVSITVDAVLDTEAFADVNAVNGIVRNLLSNAIKFTPEGGQISLRLIDDAEAIRFEVRDSGVGMDVSQLNSLENGRMKSRTGTKGESGTGLGIHLVQELVDLNQGTLDIESRIGQGTTALVSLPKQTERAA